MSHPDPYLFQINRLVLQARSQMDIDEQITNVFWCDANMILDYGYFGDVVSLDTTYCTNDANRPLAFFFFFWF